MPIMSKNQKYLVMLALLAGAAPAAVVAQDQAQDAPPADVSASVAMPAAELTEGPEIKGIISARSGDRMQVTAADGSKSVITINDDTKISASKGLFGLGRDHLAATSLLNGLPVTVKTLQAGEGLLASKIALQNKDLKTASMINNGTAQRFDEQTAATEPSGAELPQALSQIAVLAAPVVIPTALPFGLSETVPADVGAGGSSTTNLAGLEIVQADGIQPAVPSNESALEQQQAVGAVGATTPILAAGGIVTGRQMAAAMAMGAHGAWCGSVWLTTSEAETNPVVKEKMLAASSRDTVRSSLATPSGLYPFRSSDVPWPASSPAARKASYNTFSVAPRVTSKRPEPPR